MKDVTPMSASNEVVVLSPRRQPGRPAQLIGGCIAHCFADYRQFRKSAITPGAFVVRSDDADYVGSTLQQIRRDPDYATVLAFVDGAVAEKDRPLSDGPLPDRPQDQAERIEEACGRRSAMAPRVNAPGDPRGSEALLLEFMWLRPGYVLEPQADWRHPRRYRYTVLEALDRTESDPETWLHRLEQEGLIERVALKDRQRECDFCSSAHLSFIDVCPNCHSIDIEQRAALRCLNCGLVAPQDGFQRGDQHICPKCGTPVRHAGADDEQRIETKACTNCDHMFVEGEAIARCAICGHSMHPSELRLHQIYSWRMSSLGRLAAQGRLAARTPPAIAPGSVPRPVLVPKKTSRTRGRIAPKIG
jgi:hypothetical protein